MKRFHVHVQVNDLGESIRFYATLFGVNHLGLQVDSDDELRALERQLRAADPSAAVGEPAKACCG
ncbi:MAG TPA: hypothetical protein VJ011_03220 [Steroidobacteraceae bacterium]|nr:hypothetical protein [Steroidobacteraceae bacterium]